MKRKSNFQESSDAIQHKRICQPKPSNNASLDRELVEHHRNFAQYMENDNFDKIKKYFLHFTQESIEYFFEQKGLAILTWEINIRNNRMHLDFIFDNIPHEVIKKVLFQKDCYILKTFLDISLQRERRAADSEAIRGIRILKFEFMIHFIGRNKFDEIFSGKNISSKKIREDFEAAGNVYTPHTSNNLNSTLLKP